MTIIRQHVSGASTAINEQTHNGRKLAIDEVEEQARLLSKIEQNVDIMQASIEWVEVIMMHMA